jgi:hypothetical protein
MANAPTDARRRTRRRSSASTLANVGRELVRKDPLVRQSSQSGRVNESKHSSRDRARITFKVNAHTGYAESLGRNTTLIECQFAMTPLPWTRCPRRTWQCRTPHPCLQKHGNEGTRQSFLGRFLRDPSTAHGSGKLFTGCSAVLDDALYGRSAGGLAAAVPREVLLYENVFHLSSDV